MGQVTFSKPEGELVIQTIAMPANTNIYGDIFGGWLLSQMDLGASVLAHRTVGHRVTTVALDGMVFISPVKVGDRVACYARVIHRGKTSIGIQVQAWAMRLKDGSLHHVTHGKFTFVAINAEGRPTPIQWADSE